MLVFNHSLWVVNTHVDYFPAITLGDFHFGFILAKTNFFYETIKTSFPRADPFSPVCNAHLFSPCS
jgi:hypothetical protein